MRLLLSLVVTHFCISPLFAQTSVNRILNKKKFNEAGIDLSIKKEKQVDLQLTTDFEGTVKMAYLGCGGFAIDNGKQTILFDPFFSNSGFYKQLGKKSSFPEDIVSGMKAIEGFNPIKDIFNSHSHYDHLLDIPYVHERFSESNAKVYGSKSMYYLLQNVIDPSKLNVINNPADYHQELQDDQWIDVVPGMRVLPIISNHAPHFKALGIPFNFFNKDVDQPLTSYDSSLAETKASNWKKGATYSFLIEIKDNKNKTIRIFLQSSASDGYWGRLPKAYGDAISIDVALIGAASFNYTKDKVYPWQFLNEARPDWLVLCHWEDFFKPYQSEEKKFVRFTNFKKFFSKLIETDYYVKQGKDHVLLPEPGCLLTIQTN